jgi:hypothetical protein
MNKTNYPLITKKLFACHFYEGNDHFFHTHTAMLKGIAVVVYIVIIIVRITQVIVLSCKNVR